MIAQTHRFKLALMAASVALACAAGPYGVLIFTMPV